METFSQELPRDAVVKLEVSNDAPTVCDQSSDESSPSPRESILLDGSSLSPTVPLDLLQTDKFEYGALPPRKRAKTQEEKEQRRIERIMRNRQAAHASREKKRKHLEELEQKCSSLETENTQLKMAMFQSQNLRSRVEQLEMAIRLAKSSGDLSHLNDIPEVAEPAKPVSPEIGGTVNGSMLGMGAVPVDVQSTQSSATPGAAVQSDNSGSPAPSLVEDCASPEAFAVKREEEEFFLSAFPDAAVNVEHDPFEILNFSFDTKPAFTMAPDPENSLKSRHPAAVTFLRGDNSALY